MGTKTVRLDDSVYERLAELKREGETFSDAVERLLPEGSLLDLVGIFTEGQVEEIEERLGQKYERSKDSLREELGDDE